MEEDELMKMRTMRRKMKVRYLQQRAEAVRQQEFNPESWVKSIAKMTDGERLAAVCALSEEQSIMLHCYASDMRELASASCLKRAVFNRLPKGVKMLFINKGGIIYDGPPKP
ncbi:MAG TPA: hypothetical protein VFD58_31630 [Blastocatellia bacterium]|nr:hypothetical protein [Blastocatellia bacterium]